MVISNKKKLQNSLYRRNGKKAKRKRKRSMEFLEFMIVNWYAKDHSEEEISWADSDSDADSDELELDEHPYKKFHIYLTGVLENGENISIDVENFTPFFYIKIPEAWSKYKIEQFVKECKNSLSRVRRPHFLHHSVVYRKDAYGFNNLKEFKFLRFLFDNTDASKSIRYYIKKNSGKYPGVSLYNTNIEPLLTFMHSRDIQASGWVKIKKSELKVSKFAKTKHCYSCEWTEIVKVDRNVISPIKIMSFDIECYSSTGDFPSAQNKDDTIIQIGATYKHFGKGYETAKQVVHCLRETDSVKGVEIISCKTEKELLIKWFRYVIKENPDVIIGYNIDGFDWEYIYARCEKLRIVGYLEQLSIFKHVKADVKDINKTFGGNRSAMNSRTVVIPGRTQIDLYHYFKTELKLDSYKLDFVAKTFLGEKKRDVSPREIFQMGGPEGTPSSRAVVADYCAQDTLLPLKLLDNRFIIENLIEMSKCVSVPFDWLISRGQQIKVFSQLHREFRKKNTVFPETLTYSMSDSDHKYQGATVLNCDRGMHIDHPTSGLDFKSLYPSIIIEKNLCPTTIVFEDKYKNLKGIEYQHFKWENGDYWFVKNKKGIIPEIVEKLWRDRDQVKKEYKREKDPNVKNVLNAKQLAIKVSMNSIYGVFGSNVGYLSIKPIASTVTYVGRKMIEHSKKCAESFYDGSEKCDGITANVVYGDSVPGHMPVTIMNKGKFLMSRRIDHLNMNEWKVSNDLKYKNSAYELKQAKEIALPDPNLLIWSANSWVKPIKIIRHKTRKKIYRVITQKGIVECTEDHSLIENHTDEFVKPGDINVGHELLHNYIKRKVKTTNTTNIIEEKRKAFYKKFENI